MRESIKNKLFWSWYASGKHPIAGDYFKIGDGDPLLKAFADWAESGYRQLVSGQRPTSGHCSWRFWSWGGQKNVMICGVARDSSDSMGRPYPLMILGSGTLNGWESNWDLLPYTLEGIWSEIERLACGRFADLEQLKDGLSRIKLPSANWLDWANQRAMVGTLNAGQRIAGDPHAMVQQVQQLLDNGTTVIPLYIHGGADSFLVAGYWNFALKAHVKNVPNAVFMGGIPEKSFLVIFNRSLTTEDFVRLWDLNSP